MEIQRNRDKFVNRSRFMPFLSYNASLVGPLGLSLAFDFAFLSRFFAANFWAEIFRPLSL